MEKYYVNWTINDVDGVQWAERDEDLGKISFEQLQKKVDEELDKGACSFVICLSKGKEENAEPTSSTGGNP